LGHREHALEDATALTDTIMSKLPLRPKTALITAPDITKATHEVLKRFDTLPSVHYAAFHPGKN